MLTKFSLRGFYELAQTVGIVREGARERERTTEIRSNPGKF